MKELEFLKIIKGTLSQNRYIGDDCAFLKDLGIVITHDSLVEGIHFCTETSTPYQTAYKTIMVNLSDIFASGAVPAYITISLSLPQYIDENFVKEFYSAVESLSQEYGFEIIGGDITGADKIFISACAIGLAKDRNISSRSNAKAGDYIVTTGEHGSSAAGLFLIKQKNNDYPDIVKSHLMPSLSKNFSNEIAAKADRGYAMMDTSDGLADALFKIAQASNVTLSVDFDKIPYNKIIEKIAKNANLDFKDWVLYGGEDFQLVACIDKKNLEKLDKNTYTVIGKVCSPGENLVEITTEKDGIKINDLEKTFNHFSNNK